MIEVLLANPRGFCAGVDRAIEIVDTALNRFGAPIYVRHEVVHNRYVVDNLKQKGAIFVDEVADVPDEQILIFSAHGVSQSVKAAGQQRGLTVFDATCPLVTKVHMEVAKFEQEGKECILIGHKGHPEVEGTMGQYVKDPTKIYLVETIEDVALLQIKAPDNLAYVTQTTLSVDDTSLMIKALKSRFPQITGPKKEDICYATQNRQDAVKVLAKQVDLVLVVGSQNSSNSTRLRELSLRLGTPAYLIDNASELQRAWFDGVSKVGVTAGASAPELLVQQVITAIEQYDTVKVNSIVGKAEAVTFSIPKALLVSDKRNVSH